MKKTPGVVNEEIFSESEGQLKEGATDNHSQNKSSDKSVEILISRDKPAKSERPSASTPGMKARHHKTPNSLVESNEKKKSSPIREPQ